MPILFFGHHFEYWAIGGNLSAFSENEMSKKVRNQFLNISLRDNLWIIIQNALIVVGRQKNLSLAVFSLFLNARIAAKSIARTVVASAPIATQRNQSL